MAVVWQLLLVVVFCQRRKFDQSRPRFNVFYSFSSIISSLSVEAVLTIMVMYMLIHFNIVAGY